MEEEIEEVEEREFWCYVQRPGERVFLQPIMCHQTREYEKDSVHYPAQTVMLNPNQLGVFTVSKSDINYKFKNAALKAKAKRDNRGKFKRLIGPYKSLSACMKAMDKERPKAPEELAGLLEVDNKKKDQTIAELEAKIKSLEKKQESPSEKTKDK